MFNLHREIWWKKPDLQTDKDPNRKTSWLELFYDLIFVSLIANSSHIFANNLSLQGFRDFIILFTSVWLLWENSTFYNERFEVNDVRHRIFTFCKMIPLALLAYSMHDPLKSQYLLFVCSFLAVRMILVYMWLSAGKANASVRAHTIQSSCIHIGSSSLWIASLFLPNSGKFPLLFIAIAIDYLVSLGTLRFTDRLPQISRSHLPERFGLFTLLVIAEIIMGVISGASSQHQLTWKTGILSIQGLFLAFIIWWSYFDLIIFVSFKQTMINIIIWTRLHLPLTISITCMGTSMLHLISRTHQSIANYHWLLAGSVSCFLFILFLLIIVSDHSSAANEMNLEFQHRRKVLIYGNLFASLISLLSGFIAKDLPSTVYISIFIFLILFQCVHGLYIWVRAQQGK
ncbi:Low temperature requirement protein LtrA [Seinonella peptonophila]|uniref:Low temperature requirement protein LtrA n=1 Tax=Seinonella peptonophila TaxID=112248 RepID=A0A1M4U9G3_9BACL|nr:low temperature requirement protein A [Seinonella peptonophila]SHE53432.1 Low temperature requirement protein LtrA [Seinonella peptonophila]